METNFVDMFKVAQYQMHFMTIMDNIYKKSIDINMFKKFLRGWGICEAELIKNETRYQKNYIHNHPTTKEEDTTTLNEYRTKIIKGYDGLLLWNGNIKINQYQLKCAMLFTSFKNNIMFINGIEVFYNKMFR